MPNLQPSPPFNLATHDYQALGIGALLAAAAAVLTYIGVTAIPILSAHTANDYGTLIVILLTAAVKWALDVMHRYTTDTTTVVKLILVALTLGLPSSLLAAPDDTAILVDGAVAAKYIVYVDGQGGVTFSPLARVVRPGPAPLPPNPPTPPGPLTDRAKAIRDAALAVTGDPDRANTAKGFAELCRQIATFMRANPTISPAAVEGALTTGIDKYLSQRGPPAIAAAWKPVRGVFGDQLTILDFQKAHLADYATLFDEVASGFDASAPGASISPQLLQLIMWVLQIILTLLKIPVPPLPTP